MREAGALPKETRVLFLEEWELNAEWQDLLMSIPASQQDLAAQSLHFFHCKVKAVGHQDF